MLQVGLKLCLVLYQHKTRSKMKLIAIEEHFLTKAVKDEWNKYSDKDEPSPSPPCLQ